MKIILVFLVFITICWLNLTADLNEELVAHYPFNGNANDESGNGNNGTVNSATLTTDRFGNGDSAYGFDGIDDYILIDHNQSLNFLSNNFSISIWINTSNLNRRETAICKFDNNTQIRGWYIDVLGDEGGIIRTGFHSSNNDYSLIDSETSVSDGNWHNIVVIKSATNSVEIFIDGNNDSFNASLSGYPDSPDNDVILEVGGQGWFGSNFSNSIIDDIRIYNRELSFDEIQELYFHANFIVQTSAYIGEEIQFTDTSIGNPTSWEWDFENDGTYDSFIQNPTYTYNSEGIYSVKLKISNETLVDSLIKENLVTVSYCPPAFPQNVNVEILGDDAIISWAEVDTTICGSSITPDLYVIQYNEIAQNSDYFYLSYVLHPNLSFNHFGVLQYGNNGEPSDHMFYKVITIKNYSREQIEYLESLNNSREKLKWSEVKRNLETKKIEN